MRNYGETDYEKKLIRINPKKSKKNPTHIRPVNKGASKYPEVLDSIKHELLHKENPKMREARVRKETIAWVKRASKAEKARLYAKLK